MISVGQCLICKEWQYPKEVMADLLDTGLIKTEPYLCEKCRGKIMELLYGKTIVIESRKEADE